MIRIRLRYVIEAAPTKPTGYISAVLDAGKVDGEWVELNDRDYKDLAQRFPPLVTAQAARLTRSAIRWVTHGLQVTPDAEHFDRSAICALCPAWDARNQRCRECGCYAVKLWLATEQCPIGRW